ncbi:MAG: hypothetical protein BMS9Abin39_0851 [Ignavibacteria bacterium]|nr:MAG: hypothetical protein BMS9Abin39_0851 [Ignavibacteria bacterium]
MDILSIESERSILAEKLSSTTSPRIRLLYLFHYYDKILNTSDNRLIDSYLPEHIENYIHLFQQFNPIGIHPGIIKDIFLQVDKLSIQYCLKEYSSTLKSLTNELKSENDRISKVLNGIKNETTKGGKLCFPVIEQSEISKDQSFGLLETITVQIKGAAQKTNFHITPAGKEIERAIGEQIAVSWQLAVNNIGKYIRRIKPYHQVFIQFDHKYGEYVGNSLGIALTLAFQKELLQFYNAPVIIDYNGKVALTGGLNEEGNILPVSEEVIKQKTATIFFSDVDVFVVNDGEKSFVINKLEELQKEYPERSLKIIGVEDFEDLLNRRNIVSIKKQHIAVRSAKYARKHWANTVLSIVAALIIAYLFILDFDANPAAIEHSGKLRLIKNKNGKVLWQSKLKKEVNQINNNFAKISEKIIDIDGDGLNEVLLVNQDENLGHTGRLDCFSNNGELLWKYEFDDSIETINEKFSNKFNIRIVGIDNLNGREVLYLFAQHNIYFPTAVFRLDAETGKRLPGTFWNPGGLGAGTLADMNSDGVNELYLTGLNNEWETAVFFGLEKDSLYGRGPAFGKYVYPDREISEFLVYLSIPKSDYSKYKNVRYPNPGRGNLYYLEHENLLSFGIIYGEYTELIGVGFRINQKYEIDELIITDQFRVKRDSLVAQGKLSLPLTDTKEYVEILKDQVRYWNGERFISYEEWKNKSRPE